LQDKRFIKRATDSERGRGQKSGVLRRGVKVKEKGRRASHGSGMFSESCSTDLQTQVFLLHSPNIREKWVDLSGLKKKISDILAHCGRQSIT
jgi:hypothetical protein